jgi:plastocyanin
MKLLRVFQLLGVSLLLIGAVAACSDDDDDGDAGEPAATTAPAASSGDSVSVEAKDFSFAPATFTVAAGEEVTVTLNNTGNARHTLTVYTDEEYSDPVDGAETSVSAGETGEFKATFEGGEYYFRCEVHPTQMMGEFEAE